MIFPAMPSSASSERRERRVPVIIQACGAVDHSARRARVNSMSRGSCSGRLSIAGSPLPSSRRSRDIIGAVPVSPRLYPGESIGIPGLTPLFSAPCVFVISNRRRSKQLTLTVLIAAGFLSAGSLLLFRLPRRCRCRRLLLFRLPRRCRCRPHVCRDSGGDERRPLVAEHLSKDRLDIAAPALPDHRLEPRRQYRTEVVREPPRRVDVRYQATGMTAHGSRDGSLLRFIEDQAAMLPRRGVYRQRAMNGPGRHRHAGLNRARPDVVPLLVGRGNRMLRPRPAHARLLRHPRSPSQRSRMRIASCIVRVTFLPPCTSMTMLFSRARARLSS